MIAVLFIITTRLMATTSTSTSNDSSSNVLNNETSSSYVKSQKAHHVILGSTTKRWPSRQIHMANLRLPSIHADCNGIDIFKGAFSFINAEHLVSMLKDIGSATTGFAFYLALETVSPQIASGIKHLAKVIQEMNALNIGSCESAAALMGAVVPRHSRLHANTCKLMKDNGGVASDFVAARNGCKEGGAFRTDIDKSEDSELKNILQESCNVAWYVLNQNTKWDKPLKEVLMSITGTVVTEPKKPYRILPPLILQEGFWEAFETGGETDIYTCDDKDKHKCLAVGPTPRALKIDESHTAHVKKLISSIEDKLYTNKALDPLEINLIEQSRIPILKIINVMSAYHKGKAPISIQMYENVIAHDLLTQHIKHLVSIIRQIASNVRNAQINAEPLKQYMQQLKIVESKLRERDQEIYRKADQIMQIIHKLQLLEKSVFANMRVLAP